MDQPPQRKRCRPSKVCLLDRYKSYLMEPGLPQRPSHDQRDTRARLYRVGEHGQPIPGPARKPDSLARLSRPFPHHKPSSPKRPASARQVARWIRLEADQRTDWQNGYLARLFELDPTVKQTQELVQSFGTLLRKRQGDCFDGWLQLVEEEGMAELRSFALGLKKDDDAVKAGLTLVWSNDYVA